MKATSTNSIAFPNMFDVSKNAVSVLDNTNSVTNRSRLLIKTEPTELYMNPNFGVGLKRYLFQYNNANQRAIIQDRIIEQLKLHEPCVQAERTIVADGLLFSGDNDISAQNYDKLKLTVMLVTIYGDNVEVEI